MSPVPVTTMLPAVGQPAESFATPRRLPTPCSVMVISAAPAAGTSTVALPRSMLPKTSTLKLASPAGTRSKVKRPSLSVTVDWDPLPTPPTLMDTDASPEGVTPSALTT